MTSNLKSMYPLSAALDLEAVRTAPATRNSDGVQHSGFDEDQVKSKLGAARFTSFMMKLVNDKAYSGSVFSCGHALKNGVEAHAIYATDLELFLRNGG